MSIKVNHVIKTYGQQKALDDVSFEIGMGQIVGFLGPNGAGKSTMMKILTCYIPQTSGQVSVCGYDISEHSIEVRKNVGYLPEHNPLYLDMYVKEYLEFIGGIHQVKQIKKRVAEMIELTGLTIEQKKKIGELSKGYRQRVGLAQALIHDPQVLILDEPTTGLDPNQLSEIRNLIKNLGKEKTVMLSTHIMQEVEAICDRVIIINKGKIVANSQAGEIQQETQSKQVFLVEFSNQVFEQDLLNIDGVIGLKNTGKNLWEIYAETNNDIRSNIFNFSILHKTSILTLQKSEQKLEETFKRLTSENNNNLK